MHGAPLISHFLEATQGYSTARYETQGQNGKQKHLSGIESNAWTPEEPHKKCGSNPIAQASNLRRQASYIRDGGVANFKHDPVTITLAIFRQEAWRSAGFLPASPEAAQLIHAPIRGHLSR